MKEKALIASVSKRSANTNWIIGIFYNNKFTTLSIKENGSVILSPRFKAFLVAVEQKAKRYPVDVTFNHLKENREIEIKFFKEEPIYIDGSFSLNKLLQNARIHFTKEVKGNPLSIPNKVFKKGEAEQKNIEKSIAFDNEDYMMIARIESVISGDTICVKPKQLSSKLINHFSIDDVYKIQYNGINTAQSTINEEKDILRNKENEKIAKLYKVGLDVINNVAEDAKAKNMELLGGTSSSGNLAIIVFDRNNKGELIIGKESGQYVADVYATRDQIIPSVMDKIKNGSNFVHVNKTLLISSSTKHPTIPLAIYTAKDGILGDSALNPMGWATELEISEYDIESKDPARNVKATKAKTGDVPVPETTVNTRTIEFKGMIDPVSNALDFFRRYDDRFDEFVKGVETRQDLVTHTRTRIGDVILQIPPTSIRVNKEASISRLKTLRTKSSVLVNSGQTMTTLTLDLYFHDLESINGRAIPWKEGSDKVFYVDGLRPLLAQFAKCPFVPIDNYYINNALGVNDVALLSIDVNTVPNFPESMVATITLVDFNCEAYFLDKSCLSESINYPLMRWFYNSSMVDRGEKYRVFKELNGPLDDTVLFSLADSEVLEERKAAIAFLKTADSPEKRRMDVESNVENAAMIEDANNISEIFRQRSTYLQFSKKDYNVVVNKDHIKGFNLQKALQTQYLINKETAENAVEIGNEWFREIYFSLADNDYDASSYSNFIHYRDLYIPPLSQFYFPDRLDNYGGNMVVDYSKKPYKGTENDGLFLIRKPSDPKNQQYMEKKFKDYFNKKTNSYAIPATAENFNDIDNNICDRKIVIDRELDEYEAAFKNYVNIVNMTEANIPMFDYEIDGEYITTNVSASFSNEFSMIKTQSSDGPTFQYLGGGDPSITMVFEMDETAVKSFRELLDTSDEYCKLYNQGITNGFIGINNDLANLFGIKNIMIENCQINTVEGFPGRFQVVVTAVGFDKTQKQREELVEFSGFANDTDKESLKGKEIIYANDRMLEARLKGLEIYPDLELPTYEELNKAIKDLDIGYGVTEYPNRTNAIYVDPDFYFATGTTFRDIIEDQWNKRHRFNMYDSTGVALGSASDDQKGLFRTTEDNWAKLKEMNEDDDVQPLNWVYQWESGQTEKTLDTLLGNGAIRDKASVNNAEVKAFLDEKDENGNFKFYTFPTYEEWKELFPNHTEEQYKNRQKQPSQDEIYKYLDEKVDKYFKKYYHSPEWVKNLKGDNAETKPKSVLRPCYSSPDDYYAACYSWEYNHLDTVKQTKVSNLVKEEKITKPKIDEDEMRYSDVNKKGLHYKERIMTQMRAFLSAASGWTHLVNGKVIINQSKTKVGLAYVDISSADMDLLEAKRIMYNWRHNLMVAVRDLAKCYEKARELKEDCKNFGPYCRPLDMMIYHYDKPDGQANTVKYMKKSELCAATINAFGKYKNRPYDTHNGYNNKVLAYHLGEKGYIIDKTLGKKKDYIDKLLEYEYYDLKVLEANKLTVKSGYSKIKPVMKKHLEELTKDQVFSIFTNHLTKLKALADDDMFAGERDENGYYYSVDLMIKARADYVPIQDANESFANSQNESMRQLVCSDDPQALYRTMFYEMRRYDHRGRMLRAFPSFAMFIIHEGDTYGKYKFWDNTFGFNAIESIDVHRSRKIAADTAIINMSNVYSNLTTRRTDVDYLDRQLKFWDNVVFNNPPDELAEKKKNEEYKSIYLETGARIHLRMGYGANAQELPVVFNGTITEIEYGDVVQIIGQGDGIELGNVISGDPDDDNDGIFCVTEPRDLICKFLASKGSWTKDFLNRVSENRLFKDNPLGISHFGQAFDTTTHSQPSGTLVWCNDEYGEVAQNIYSSNGTPTFSQWLTPSGERNNIATDFSWDSLWNNKFKWFNPGDERNIVMNFYNQTVWDVIQTITYASPDYICAVHPFETRSTLFFGKPYWPAALSYDSRYEYDEGAGTWSRYLEGQPRRSYMQQRFYTSYQDIIENNICASEDGLYTNVIVNYDGHQTPILFADVDIRYDKLKTRSIDANIVAKFGDFYTSEVMATYYGCSALRDNLKDMYRGSFLVVGDPSVKPHDMFYMQDERNDMNGTALVKSVTHHFSFETGFVTKIEPDLLAVNDDTMMLEFGKWAAGMGANLACQFAAYYMTKKIFKRSLGKWILNTDKLPKNVAQALGNTSMKTLAKYASNGDKEMKEIYKLLKQLDKVEVGSSEYVKAFQAAEDALKAASKNIKPSKGFVRSTKVLSKKGFIMSGVTALKAIKTGKNIFSAIKSVVSFVTLGNPASAVIGAAVWIGSELIFENVRRFKENLQTVIIMPLSYQGKELTAGVNSHAGLVYGEAPGKIKKYFDATFGTDDGEVEDMTGNFLVELTNFFSGSGGAYKDPEVEEKIEKEYQK